jgi:hypothetical protein
VIPNQALLGFSNPKKLRKLVKVLKNNNKGASEWKAAKGEAVRVEDQLGDGAQKVHPREIKRVKRMQMLWRGARKAGRYLVRFQPITHIEQSVLKHCLGDKSTALRIKCSECLAKDVF